MIIRGINNVNRNSVCHVSTVHDPDDTRIVIRECSSLSGDYHVHLVCRSGHSVEVSFERHLLPVVSSRIKRVIMLIPLALIKAYRTKAFVIHLHDPELYFLSPLLKLCGRRVILDIHENYNVTISKKKYLKRGYAVLLEWVMKLYLRFTLPTANAIILAWPALEDVFLGYNPKRIVVRNLPRLEETHRTIKPGRESLSDRKFVYLGLINEARGALKLFEWVDLYRKRTGNTLRIDFYGKIAKEFEPKFTDCIEKCPSVHYNGIVRSSEVESVLDKYDFGFVFFSNIRNHLYSEPNKLFEYYRSGVVPICSNLPRMNEIIGDSQSGLVVNLSSSLGIGIDEFINLFSNENNINEHIQNGYNYLLNNNWQKEYEKLKKLYDEILD